MPTKEKRVKKANAEGEQLILLRQILAELHALNANIGTSGAAIRAAKGSTSSDDSDDDDELQEYE